MISSLDASSSGATRMIWSRSRTSADGMNHHDYYRLVYFCKHSRSFVLSNVPWCNLSFFSPRLPHKRRKPRPVEKSVTLHTHTPPRLSMDFGFSKFHQQFALTLLFCCDRYCTVPVRTSTAGIIDDSTLSRPSTAIYILYMVRFSTVLRNARARGK